MSIRIESRRGKTTVETDYRDGFGCDHSGVYEDRELMGGMSSYGINKIEVEGIGESTDVRGALRDEFDKEFQKTHDSKYFGW